jgi:hypothetical protein
MRKIEMCDDDWIKHMERLPELRRELHAGSTWQIRRLSIHDYAQEMLRISYAYFIEDTHEDV